jgi:hypothetical protein
MTTFDNTRNPILPLDVHVPDSEPHVMPDGKLYVYGSYDLLEDVYCSEEYHVVSTPDMKRWTVHDKSLDGKNVPWFNDPDAVKYPGIDWSHPTPFILRMMERDRENGVDMKAEFEKNADKPKPPLLFAPDCLEKDGRYYLYFCMPDDSEGVAVSDRPEGPFTDIKQLPIGGIDPAVFIDDDGQAYLYWGQLFSHGVKLNADMVSLDRENIVDDLVTETGHFFHEGSSMRRIGDTYYYIYADMERGKPTSLGYSTASSPLGPFTYRGIIIDNDGCDPASWNNHGSICCFDGQWYVFYHRCSRGVQQHRRLCVEKLTIAPDGSIPEVKMTSQGVGEPFGPGEAIYGYQACGVTGSCYIGLGGPYTEQLMNIAPEDTAVFRYVRSDRAFTEIRLEAAGSGKLEVLMNGQNAGAVVVKDGEQLSREINAAAGEYELTLRFVKADGLEIRKITLF